MRMMSYMKLIKTLITVGLVLFFSFQGTAGIKMPSPESEFNKIKAQYPEEPIITLIQKKEVEITTDENGVPIMHIKETRIDMILAERGAEISEGKEFFNSKDVVKKIEAYSLVPDGNKYKKMVVSNLKKSVEFDDHLYFDDSYCYSFNFPATAKGVKRCTYSETEIHDPYHPLLFYFAGFLPIDRAELVITMPQNLKINYRIFGGDISGVQEDQQKKGNLITYRWTSHQLKVKDRDFMAPGFRYFRPHLIAQIASFSGNENEVHYIGNQKELYQWYYSKIETLNDTISPEIKQLTDSVTMGISDSYEKVRAIYKWVQNSIKYIAIEDGENGFVPREASLVLKRRYGDCKDKTSLLTTMIRSIGEKADFALVGTRELPYKFSEFPTVACANHMVAVYWNKDNPMVLDGTSRQLKMEDVPAFIQGKECLIEAGSGHFQIYQIPVAEPFRNTQSDTIKLTLNHDLLLGTGSTVATGEIRTNLAFQLERQEIKKQLDYWSTAIYSSSAKLQVTKIQVFNLAEVNQPINVNFEFQLPDYLTRQGKSAYVNMNVERLLTSLEVKPDRTIPIEVESTWEHNTVYKLKVPDNMSVTYLPAPVAYNNTLFGFSQNYEQTNNEIVLKSRIYMNTLLVEGEDITSFREMLESLRKAYRQTIAITMK